MMLFPWRRGKQGWLLQFLSFRMYFRGRYS